MNNEQVEAERASNTVAALKTIEEGCAALLETLHGLEADRYVDGYELGAPEGAIRGAMNFAWAMRTFPLFDIECLSRMKEGEFDVPPRLGDKKFKGKLFVPAFAWRPWYDKSTAARIEMFDGASRLSMSGCGLSCVVSFDSALIQKNAEALREKGVTHIVLEAKAPPIPEGVRRRVSAIENRLESVNVVWDAEWEPAPLRDPLVIGRIFHRYFLLDQFDVTKLERYVVSEFCTKKE